MSVIEERKLPESGSSYYGFPHIYDGYEEEDDEEAATAAGSASSSSTGGGANNHVLQQCLLRTRH